MPNKNSGFDLFADRKVANEISKRYEQPESRQGVDRVDVVEHKFHTNLELTPIIRW